MEVAVAQLSIVDGAWQESPDNLGTFEETALFGEGLARGSLYLVTEVAGEPEGRDELARELIETTRREYAASRGSISLALTQAIRAANEFFYNANANLPPEARRIAGITAAVVRDDEMFIAQAGPGLVCLMRGDTLQSYPETSPWFIADESAVAEWLSTRNFETPGAVPMGLRPTYLPDLFHASLEPSDVILLATRALAHLLSVDELRDTLARRHPDEIVASLEDLAGAADLSVIALRVAGEPTPAMIASQLAPRPPMLAPVPPEEEIETLPPFPLSSPDASRADSERAKRVEEGVEEHPEWEERMTGERGEDEPAAQPTEEELARQREQAEKARVQRAKIRAGFLGATAGIIAVFAGILGRINWSGIGNAAYRAIAGIVRGIVRLIVFLIRAVAPGEPGEDRAPRGAATPRSSAWQLAAIVFPILLIIAGLFMWVNYRQQVEQQRATLIAKLTSDGKAALERARQLLPSDRTGARDAAQNAMDSASRVRAMGVTNVEVNKTYYDASDFLDELKGVKVLFAQTFLTFSDPKADPSRIVPHYPDVFVLDRALAGGVSRIYRYSINEAGIPATPAPGDGVILKAGDKIGERTVGTLIDLALVDATRLVAFDRNGAFLQYDIPRAAWTARGASDPGPWARVNLAASFGGNVYLVDAPSKQILKYAPNQDGWWTSAVTFFVPGSNPDLANVVDLSIDRDVWLLRSTGALLQCTAARCTDVAIRELDQPFSKPVAAFTSEALSALYVADAGNQRIVQVDKATSRFARQFKPSAANPSVMKSLKTLTADDKRFYFISENKAYVSNIPQ